MHRHLPRNIQEQIDPSLKRKRHKEENLQRVAQHIHSDFSKQLGRRYLIQTERQLEEVVDQLIDLKDIKINNRLQIHLQGYYPNLCRKVIMASTKLKQEQSTSK